MAIARKTSQSGFVEPAVFTRIQRLILSYKTNTTQYNRNHPEISLLLLLAIICYNKEKIIAQVINGVFNVLPNAHIYMFDNNPHDKSRSIIKYH